MSTKPQALCRSVFRVDLRPINSRRDKTRRDADVAIARLNNFNFLQRPIVLSAKVARSASIALASRRVASNRVNYYDWLQIQIQIQNTNLYAIGYRVQILVLYHELAFSYNTVWYIKKFINKAVFFKLFTDKGKFTIVNVLYSLHSIK